MAQAVYDKVIALNGGRTKATRDLGAQNLRELEAIIAQHCDGKVTSSASEKEFKFWILRVMLIILALPAAILILIITHSIF